jgi:hypothetical protein
VSATSLYFVGGSRHGEWLTIDDRMSHVEVPHVEPPSLADLLDPYLSPVGPLRLDLYQVRRVVLTEEHPCVPGAGLARLYRCAVWSKMPPDAMPPARQLVERGTVEQQQHVDHPWIGGGPWWWLWPELPARTYWRGALASRGRLYATGRAVLL